MSEHKYQAVLDDLVARMAAEPRLVFSAAEAEVVNHAIYGMYGTGWSRARIARYFHRSTVWAGTRVNRACRVQLRRFTQRFPAEVWSREAIERRTRLVAEVELNYLITCLESISTPVASIT